MKKLLLAALLLTIPGLASAQTVTITDTATFAFTASSDHNTLFGGTPILTNYSLTFTVVGQTTPAFTVNLAKPTPDAQNQIITAPIKKLAPILPNTEYTARLSAVGPGGTNSVNLASPFGYPGPATAPGNFRIIP